MMATPHMVVGAALGRALRRPWLAYPAALASHFLLDTVPHLDAHGMFGTSRGGPTRAEATAAVVDFLVGVLVVVLVARPPRRRVMLLAGLLGILPDLVEYVPPLGPWFQSWAGAHWLVTFHHAIQHNLTPAQWPLGAATQLAVVALSLAVCLSGRRTAPRGQSLEASS